MIGPGLGRAMIIFGGVPFPSAVTIAYYVSEALALIFFLNDLRKGANIKPFLTILVVLVINHFIWASQDAVWWQKIAKWFVTVTF